MNVLMEKDISLTSPERPVPKQQIEAVKKEVFRQLREGFFRVTDLNRRISTFCVVGIANVGDQWAIHYFDLDIRSLRMIEEIRYNHRRYGDTTTRRTFTTHLLRHDRFTTSDGRVPIEVPVTVTLHTGPRISEDVLEISWDSTDFVPKSIQWGWNRSVCAYKS